MGAHDVFWAYHEHSPSIKAKNKTNYPVFVKQERTAIVALPDIQAIRMLKSFARFGQFIRAGDIVVGPARHVRCEGVNAPGPYKL